VPFDRSRRNPELLSALLRREALRDALEHLALALGQGDEILLLTRKIHRVPLMENPRHSSSLITLAIARLQQVERAVPNSDRVYHFNVTGRHFHPICERSRPFRERPLSPDPWRISAFSSDIMWVVLLGEFA
jgi:hypothetical protein